MAVMQLVSDSLKREISKAITHTTRGLGRAAKRLLSEREEEFRSDGEEGEVGGGERRTGMRLTRARAHMDHSTPQQSPIALPIDSSLEAREVMAIDPTGATSNTLGVEGVVGQQITQDMAMEAAAIMDGGCSSLGITQESGQPTRPLSSSGAYLGINAPQTTEDGADIATIMKDVALLLSSE